MILAVLLLTACCAYAAADTSFALEECAGNISINESDYIVLTPGNLDDHPDLLASLGKGKEDVLADWQARGVQLQAWNQKGDVCLEVSVSQDDDSKEYYDLEQQTRQVRAEYLKNFKSNKKYADLGYTVMSHGTVIKQMGWKKQKNGGNFIMFEYKRTGEEDGQPWRGLVRHTIRNGYTVVLDYRIYNRLPIQNDDKNLNKIANTVSFVQKDYVPGGQETTTDADGQTIQASEVDASGLLTVTVKPPEETLDGIFTVEGKTTPEAKLIGVAMRWVDNSEPSLFYADATKAGNFKVKFELPEEGVWQITLDLELNGEVVTRTVFDTVTFSKSQLPIQLDEPVPEKQTSDELTLSGVTTKGVEVQCIVTLNDDANIIYQDTVRTNGTGKFKFAIPTVLEGTYNIRISLQKKNFSPRPKTYQTTRTVTAQDTRDRTAKDAIHPAYNTLVKKTDSYLGQTMVYDVYILKVEQVGEEWIITTAQKKSKDTYKNYLVYVAKADPRIDEGIQVKMYGVCTGTYKFQSEEGEETCPQLEYLFKD